MAFISDYSTWHLILKDSAIQLLNFQGSLWVPNADKNSLDKKKIDPSSVVSPLHFKVLLGVALEYAIKALCLSKNIDILKKPHAGKQAKGPFGSIQAAASNNPWLQSCFDQHGVNTVNDINTKDFKVCIDALKSAFSGDLSALATIDAIDNWREVHRNTDAHISNKINYLDEYERIRPFFNSILQLIV